MLKHILAVAAFAVAFLGITVTYSPAHAGELYGAVRVGQAVNTEAAGIDLADDVAYGAAIGYDAGWARFEGGVNRITADTGGLSIAAIDYSATIYLDLPISERGALFGGAGVDYVQAEANAGFFALEGEGSGWHLTGGYAHRFDALTVEVGVNHLQADLEFSGFDVEASTDVVFVGARFAL